MLGQMLKKTPQSMVSPVCLTGRLEDGISDGNTHQAFLKEVSEGQCIIHYFLAARKLLRALRPSSLDT